MKVSSTKSPVPKGTTVTLLVPREDGTKVEAVYEVAGFMGYIETQPLIEEGQVHNDGFAWSADPDRIVGFDISLIFHASKMTVKEA